MVMYWPVQQELDCINLSGSILGKIKFDSQQEAFVFCPDNASVVLSADEQASIDERIAGLHSGKYAIPMQDDD